MLSAQSPPPPRWQPSEEKSRREHEAQLLAISDPSLSCACLNATSDGGLTLYRGS